MHFKRQSHILLSLESLALTDIIMNMFVFFFITFSFLATFDKSEEGQVTVSLPKAASTAAPTQRKNLTVSLTKEGGLFLNQEAVTFEQLRARFQVEKTQAAEITLIVRADQEVQHGQVVEVMDLARTEGLQRLAIATQAK
jgi:biopolymer transport protein ExbD